MMRRILLILLPLLVCTTMKGQRVMEWEEFVEYISSDEDILESLGVGNGSGEGEGTEGSDAWEEFIDELQQLHHQPININNATSRQLHSLPLLSARQAEDIVKYLDIHHGMHSLSELLLIPTISYRERQYLPLFLYAGEPSSEGKEKANEWKSIWKDGQHSLLTRFDIPFYHRRGYLVKNGYKGASIYNKVYYNYETSRHFSAGIRAERDGGERGIDSYGAHIMLRNMPLLKASHPRYRDIRLESLVVGDYKVGFGMGLVLNQGFSVGKWSTTMRQSQGFRPHKSTEEVNFMRGIASSVSVGRWTLSAFYSHRQWDATLNKTETQGAAKGQGAKDAQGEAGTQGEGKASNGDATQSINSLSTVKTIVRNGYHRTETERGKRGVLGVDVVGGHAVWQKGGMHMGMTGYFQKTDKRLDPGTSAYRRIYPQGNHFGGASVDYGYEAYRWSVRGETAYGGTLLDFATDPAELRGANKRNGLATLNSITWIASPRYRLTAIQRYYNRNYYCFYSRALSDNSGVQNETGGLIRLDASPVDGIQMAAYMDVFYNPWPRYGLQRSSFGWEGMAEAEYAISRRNSLNIRYNVKQKDQVETKTKTQYAVTDHRLRLQWQRTSYSNEWQVKATLMLHAREGSLGKAIGGTCRYKDKKSRCQVAASGVYFHTNDYNSRIFMFEPNVSEMANFPSFYGHGIHGTAVLRGYLWKRMLSLELKYGVTRYFDRETQGSGLQTIYSNVKNDLTLQARLRI